MDDQKPIILDSTFHEKEYTRRRKLLPWWIKVFIWIFLIPVPFIPLGFIASILGWEFKLALYGLESNSSITVTGLLLSLIFLIKAITSISLWMEKDWAIDLAMIDAIVGIVICLVVMILLPIVGYTGIKFEFRLELILLIPYLFKLKAIREDWKNPIESREEN